jgi:hypothetical protein
VEVQQDDVAEIVKGVFKFHSSDFAGTGAQEPVTIEEEARLISELADLYGTDALQFTEKLRVVAKRLNTTQEALKREVKLERDRKPRNDGNEEQSQSTKLMAIGLGDEFLLWHSPDGVACASVRVEQHWEH